MRQYVRGFKPFFPGDPNFSIKNLLRPKTETMLNIDVNISVLDCNLGSYVYFILYIIALYYYKRV